MDVCKILCKFRDHMNFLANIRLRTFNNKASHSYPIGVVCHFVSENRINLYMPLQPEALCTTIICFSVLLQGHLSLKGHHK